MATSFGALCTDFYINLKLALKMDLPTERETILHLFDRVRKSEPAMDRFRRYDNELALESSRRETQYKWLALRRASLRTGHVNPEEMTDAYGFHRLILQIAPHYLTISPLDVDYLELTFGFDLECQANHDEVVYDALYGDAPMADLLRPFGSVDENESKVLDVQPLFGMSLCKSGDLQAFFEVKSRTRSRRGQTGRSRDEPLSLFLTVRRYGPIRQVDDIATDFDELAEHAETLATERLVPHMLTPIARQITSSSAGGGDPL